MLNVNFKKGPYSGDLNNLVDNLFNELPIMFKSDFNNSNQKDFIPVNVKETDKGFQLDVIAPGFNKEDFKISLDETLLTISAEHKMEESKETEKQIKKEYNFRSFKRSFTIDEKIDATKIEASYVNGVLTLNLPKKEVVKVSAKEIEIK